MRNKFRVLGALAVPLANMAFGEQVLLRQALCQF